VRDGLERILSRSRIAREKIMLISISSKGLVNPNEAVLTWSPIFGSDRIDFEACSGRTGRPGSFSTTRRCWWRQRSAPARRRTIQMGCVR
jgi:hypothetical protein